MLGSKMDWTPHIDQQVTRENKIINDLRIIRRKFNTKQLSQIVTSQVFGVLYYGAATWFTTLTKSTDFKKLTKLHYVASRIIVGNWRCTQSRDILDQQTNRLPPKLWLKYDVSSPVIKIMRYRQPTILHGSIAKSLYLNERHVNPVTTDRSVGRKGLKSISN